MIRAAAYVTTILLRISDVIGCASTEFYVERGSGSVTKALDFVSDLTFSLQLLCIDLQQSVPERQTLLCSSRITSNCEISLTILWTNLSLFVYLWLHYIPCMWLNLPGLPPWLSMGNWKTRERETKWRWETGTGICQKAAPAEMTQDSRLSSQTEPGISLALACETNQGKL